MGNSGAHCRTVRNSAAFAKQIKSRTQMMLQPTNKSLTGVLLPVNVVETHKKQPVPLRSHAKARFLVSH